MKIASRAKPCLIKGKTMAVLAGICLFAIIVDVRAEDGGNAKSTAAIQSMHDEIANLKITVERESMWVPAVLKGEPILHYTDPQRLFPDATLWVWLLDGQPILFSKLERMGGNPPQTQYCMATAHQARIAARWPDGIVWKSQKAGIQFRPIDQADLPQKTAPLRLVQLRSIARKFRATTTDHVNQSEEMRMLTQPILRYSNAGQSLVDGAVFALTSNGTNPDALLLVQVRHHQGDKPVWEYGCLGMTGDHVAVEFDGQSVYKHAGKPGPGDHGYWLWTIAPTQ